MVLAVITDGMYIPHIVDPPKKASLEIRLFAGIVTSVYSTIDDSRTDIPISFYDFDGLA